MLLLIVRGQQEGQVSRILAQYVAYWKNQLEGLWRLGSPSKVRYGVSKLDLRSHSYKTPAGLKLCLAVLVQGCQLLGLRETR